MTRLTVARPAGHHGRGVASWVGVVVMAALALTACSTGSPRSAPAATPPAARTARTPAATTAGSAASGRSPTAPTTPTTVPTLTPTVMAWRLPHPLSRGVAMADGAQILLAGGLHPGDRSTDQVLRISPSRGVVGPAAPLVKAMHDSAGAVVAGRPTVFGGGGASELDAVQRMDGSGHWHVTGHLPGGTRSDLAVAGTGHGALIIGGYDGSGTPTTILRTTDGRHFTVAGRLPSGVRYAGVARVGATVWVLGGETGGHELREVWAIDARTGAVRPAGRLPVALGHEAVVAVGSRLLVIGGRTAPKTVSHRMWWFDPADASWTRAGTLPYPVADAPSVTIGSSIYLLGGETPDFTAQVTRIRWG